jgi:hypothetical protein
MLRYLINLSAKNWLTDLRIWGGTPYHNSIEKCMEETVEHSNIVTVIGCFAEHKETCHFSETSFDF